ncbi:hypothetical protein EDD30_0938 [Couchioplanes caeruleus]|uniref:Uncharacterized protein n=1 Tax=Couchioplanes caeruleus TaxID=56438 RepID=A0A3N1GDB1_9ACTN|nr:hypothetical protein EDD30_0938 [Couchioplanes caeruleus]
MSTEQWLMPRLRLAVIAVLAVVVLVAKCI